MGFSLFPSLFERPPKIRFATQEPDEHIELFLRQHWVTNIPWLFTAFIGIALPFFVPLIEINTGVIITQSLPLDILTAVTILWYMLVLAYIIEHYLFWYFNIYIVTNKHIVDVVMQNILHIYSTEFRLDDIQSTKSNFSGLIGSLFHFGDVTILTAAEKQQVEFVDIPQPDFVRDRIQDLQESEEGKP